MLYVDYPICNSHAQCYLPLSKTYMEIIHTRFYIYPTFRFFMESCLYFVHTFSSYKHPQVVLLNYHLWNQPFLSATYFSSRICHHSPSKPSPTCHSHLTRIPLFIQFKDLIPWLTTNDSLTDWLTINKKPCLLCYLHPLHEKLSEPSPTCHSHLAIILLLI